MKTKIYLAIFLSVLLASCSSLQQSTVNDDIYFSPKDELAMNDVYDSPSTNKNKSGVLENDYEEKISNILNDESKQDLDTVIYEGESYENPYESIIVDNYSEAYDRRLNAMRSPYYGMNNYYNIYFSDSYWYASTFMGDPFYNVVIMGDQVWVEPYWMSSSFYGWGRPSHFGYYNSYYYPYYHRPYYYGSYYNSYYNPYYYGSSYSPYYYSNNNQYVSSSFHSYRQRSLSTSTMSGRSSGRASRELPENYAGRDITRSSTVKSGIDRQARTERSRESSATRSAGNGVSPETIRVRNTQRTGTTTRSANVERTNTGVSRTSIQDYSRPQSTNRSTYNTSTRSATRYNRPESTTVRSGSNSGRSSTYSPNSSGSRSGSSSTYTPSRSSTGSSTPRSSGNSGTVRSSGSSSGSSSRSSGSSGSSSSSTSSSGRSRR